MDYHFFPVCVRKFKIHTLSPVPVHQCKNFRSARFINRGFLAFDGASNGFEKCFKFGNGLFYSRFSKQFPAQEEDSVSGSFMHHPHPGWIHDGKGSSMSSIIKEGEDVTKGVDSPVTGRPAIDSQYCSGRWWQPT